MGNFLAEVREMLLSGHDSPDGPLAPLLVAMTNVMVTTWIVIASKSQPART
jgi:hypothetical protein